MAVTPQRARTLALSLENASAYPHFERTAFRTPRRTFATLALNGGDMNFMLEATQQRHFSELSPHAFAPVAGGWGRMGWTRCELSAVDFATLKAALLAAHARANAPLPKRAPAKRAPIKRASPGLVAKKPRKRV